MSKATAIIGLLVLLLIGTVVKVNGQWEPNFAPGRTTMVHLFEWRWNDIAAECERFLGPYGFAGVQVSPPNENAVITSPFRPWWERYQPVSYNLTTRSGTEAEFQSMVHRCNNVGVRIYVDAVINHMTGALGQGVGTGGTPFDSEALSYPGVPYSPLDFNGLDAYCPSASGDIHNYKDPNEVRNCRLQGLKDLNQGKAWVIQKVLEYFNKLIGYGVAGFRIDASKHMWPADMKTILDQLNNLSTDHGFPTGARPFIYMEVIDLGDEPITGSQYFGMGRVTEFKYGLNLGNVFRNWKDQLLKYLVNFHTGWEMYPEGNAFVFVDNHDNQRGHGSGGAAILTFRAARLYKMANAFMLACPYGITRVMSSYFWEQDWQGGEDKNDWIGPPSTNGNTNPVPINPDLTCGGGWICEHRWRQIYNMVRFRNVVSGTHMHNWWDNESNQIAFCRGNRGFLAINGDMTNLQQTLQTCLPAGTYCDVISGNIVDGQCTGTMVEVGSDGKANIFISAQAVDPILAIHAESRLSL